MRLHLRDRALNREILRLSLPSILANLTVPLVGIVDTALAGHLNGGVGAAAFIGGISVGSMMLTLLYWNFGFLRTGTGGLTAQAFGRKDPADCARILWRGVGLALVAALLVLLLQKPFSQLGMLLVKSSPGVSELALRYFSIRIWAAPATLLLMSFRGWFVGMQDSVSSMWTDLVVNVVNVAASVLLTFGVAGWEGLGFDGIPAGTLVAQYAGLLYVTLVCIFKYRGTLRSLPFKEVPGLFNPSALLPFLKMNSQLLIYSVRFRGCVAGLLVHYDAAAYAVFLFHRWLRLCRRGAYGAFYRGAGRDSAAAYYTVRICLEPWYRGAVGGAVRLAWRGDDTAADFGRHCGGKLPEVPAVAARDAAFGMRRFHLGRGVSGRNGDAGPVYVDVLGSGRILRLLVSGALALACGKAGSGWSCRCQPASAPGGVFRAPCRPHGVSYSRL